uniref:Transmembrane protein 192 n=1 Tax=Catagonus wagneri TaxID=51154 RepID=A0A8C3XAN4_9CETA
MVPRWICFHCATTRTPVFFVCLFVCFLFFGFFWPHLSYAEVPRPGMEPIPQSWPLATVVFVILAFLTGILCSYPNPIEDKCPGNYTNPLKVQTVIILGKVILWVLHFLLERYIQYHHSKVRNRGYNKIYRSTRHLKSLLLMIHSTGKPPVSSAIWRLA